MDGAVKKHPIDPKAADTIADILGSEGMEGAEAAAALMPLIYEELCRLAAYRVSCEKPEHTLEPAELVDEAYLRLVQESDAHWENMEHFFVAAAEAMRRILIENARKQHCLKRGGEWHQIDVDIEKIRDGDRNDDVLQVHELLDQFSAIDPESAKLVKLRFFAGLTQQKCADILGISKRTADKRWAHARAWLCRAMHDEQ